MLFFSLMHRLKSFYSKLNLDPKLTPYIPAIAMGAVVLLIVLVVGFFMYKNNQKQQSPANQAAAQEEVKRLVGEVGKLVDLPFGEDPTVATVTDIERLKGQPFFQKAKNGDKVLIYTQAKKAILYDPSAKKVIDIAPINVGSPSAQVASPSPSPKPTATPSPSPIPSPSPTAAATPNP